MGESVEFLEAGHPMDPESDGDTEELVRPTSQMVNECMSVVNDVNVIRDPNPDFRYNQKLKGMDEIDESESESESVDENDAEEQGEEKVEENRSQDDERLGADGQDRDQRLDGDGQEGDLGLDRDGQEGAVGLDEEGDDLGREVTEGVEEGRTANGLKSPIVVSRAERERNTIARTLRIGHGVNAV